MSNTQSAPCSAYEEIMAIFRASAQETAAVQREVAHIRRETAAMQQESQRKIEAMQEEITLMRKEGEKRSQEIDRQIKELGQQIGGLGKKFGSFTEGLALPSMITILREQFKMEVVSPSVRAKKDGQNMEIDVLAYANGDIQRAYVVEVKSHAREDSIAQLQKILERFHTYFPEHHDKKVFGILAAVDLSEALRERVLAEGLYVARIHDEVFTLDTPEDFQPIGY